MAISLTPQVQGETTLSEFVSFCKSTISFDDEASIFAATEMLTALANDRMLLVNAINSGLMERMEAAGEAIGVSNQSLLLYADPMIKVRANIWRPVIVRAGTTKFDESLHSYHYAHNHNFHLLTIGYLGAGYETEIHECYPDEIVGYVGEPVRLKRLGIEQLQRGRVIFFRACKDVHTQLPSPEFSLSLNLIVSNAGARIPDQYNFDIASSTIGSLISSPTKSISHVLKFIELMGVGESLPILARMVESDPEWRVRKAALECALQITPTHADSFLAIAVRDTHPEVRNVAATAGISARAS